MCSIEDFGLAGRWGVTNIVTAVRRLAGDTLRCGKIPDACRHGNLGKQDSVQKLEYFSIRAMNILSYKAFSVILIGFVGVGPSKRETRSRERVDRTEDEYEVVLIHRSRHAQAKLIWPHTHQHAPLPQQFREVSYTFVPSLPVRCKSVL